MATVMAKIEEKFEIFRQETSAPLAARPSSRSDEQIPAAAGSAASAQPVRRLSKGRRARSPSPEITQQLPINSSHSDDSPSEDIEKHIHTKTKCYQPFSLRNIAFDMRWAQLGDEVTDRLRTLIHPNEYFPLRILLTDYELDPQEDPASPTVDRKRAVVQIDHLREWLHLFMTYAAISYEKISRRG